MTLKLRWTPRGPQVGQAPGHPHKVPLCEGCAEPLRLRRHGLGNVELTCTNPACTMSFKVWIREGDAA